MHGCIRNENLRCVWGKVPHPLLAATRKVEKVPAMSLRPASQPAAKSDLGKLAEGGQDAGRYPDDERVGLLSGLKVKNGSVKYLKSS